MEQVFEAGKTLKEAERAERKDLWTLVVSSWTVKRLGKLRHKDGSKGK